MGRKQESAEKLLTITPNQTFKIEGDGFTGRLYLPQENEFKGKALIMFGGSDGSFSLTCLIAEQFVKRGLSVLALAYWRQAGLPDAIEKIPVEYIENAAVWLRSHGFHRIGLWGISKGAEYALLSASLLPELITCVVAVSPMSVCCQGIRKRKTVKLLDCSSWSFRGKELPYAALRLHMGEIVRDTLERRSICMRSCYESAVMGASEKARIKVERIRGPILLLSADSDDMWPAKEASEQMMARLEKERVPYLHRHISYSYASHFLLPYQLRLTKLFAIERNDPGKCMESNLDSFEKTLAFLKEWT